MSKANHLSIQILDATITRDGVVCQTNGINYTRIEHADGTVEERGLPAGMKPRPSITELMEHAFQPRKTVHARPARRKGGGV